MTTKFAALYADTDEGQRLPIVDVTNPVFALDVTERELEAQAERFIAESSSRTEIPPAVRSSMAPTRSSPRT